MQLKSFKTTDGKHPYELVYQHESLGESKLKRHKIPKDIADMYHEIAARVMEYIGLGSEKYGYVGFSLANKKEGLMMTVTYCTGIEDHPVVCKVAPFSVAHVDESQIDDLKSQAEEMEDEYFNKKARLLRKRKVLNEKLLDLEEMIADHWQGLSAMDYADMQTNLFEDPAEAANRMWSNTVNELQEEGIEVTVTVGDE